MADPSGSPWLSNRVASLNGKPYDVASDDQAKAVPGGSRAWDRTYIDAQEVGPQQPFMVELRDFANGAGFSFQGIPGTYDRAHGWDATNRGKLVTWDRWAYSPNWDSTTDARGWMRQLGAYVYVARGRWVLKFAVDQTKLAGWAIIERHDLGSGMVCCGRPEVFKSCLYVPVRQGVAGTLQKFLQLTTQVSTTVEQQTVTVSGTPTSGSYVLHYNGQDTAAIAYNAPAADVQSALRLLAGLEDVTVSATGSTPNFTHTVVFTGVSAPTGSSSPPQMTVTDSTAGGAHAINIATTVAGTTDTWTQGPAGREFRCFRLWKENLRAADLTSIYACSSDPMVSGNWAPTAGSGYQVGDTSSEITDLTPHPRLLIVHKEDGFYSFDENYLTTNEIPDIQAFVDASQGMGSEFALGQVMSPHQRGLILWDIGTYQFIGPEQEGGYDPLLSPGHGRVVDVAPAGRTVYFASQDSYNEKASIGSFQPASGARGPLIPHVHQVLDGRVEALGIITAQSQAIAPKNLNTFSDDNAVGTITWSNPSNAQSDDDTEATAAAGTSHYLKALNPGNSIPSSATITGILVEVERRVTS